MSNPLYNPYASENQRRLSGIQAERESHRVSSHLGHGSSLNSSGSPSTSPDNSEQRLPSLVPNYRSERSSASVNEDIQRSIYMHLSRAREESRQLGKQIHQPVDQGTHRIELLSSSGTGMMSHPHTAGHSENQSSHGSVSQLLNYSQPIADDNSTFYTSSSSSSYLDSGNSRFNVSKKGQHDIQSIPGLGDYDYPGPDKSHAVTEPSRPKYTSESAANILMQFGLEKEDLEHLIAYPEDQITPENLPFILRQIRMQKVKRATNAEKSKRNIPDPPPPRSTGGMDSWTSSRGAGMPQEEVPSSRHQQSKVIDYGHTGKYTGEMRDEMGSRRSEGGGSESLLLGNFDSSSHHKELLPKGGRSSALGSSRDHATLSSSYSSRLTSEVPSSNDQTILKSLSLLMKDTDVRVNTSDASKPLSLKELKADHQPTSKSQTSSALFHGGNPSRPGLVVIDSKYNTKGRTTNDGQGSTVAEQKKQSQQQQNSQKQLSQKQQELKQRAKQPEQKPQQQQQPKQEQKQTQKAPMQQQEPTQQKQFTMPAQMGRAVWPAAFSAGQPYLPVTPTFHIPSLFDVMRNPLLLPRTMPVPPAQPPSNSQPPMKGPVYKGSPSPDMMHDYAAASPRVFPHTCSLCNKECTQMKDWISHQNSTLHLENCKFLGRQYPDWDGEVALSDTRSKPSSSTSQHHQHKTRHGSSSSPCSPDPRWHRCSEGGRDKRRSRSRSPHSSRYSRRSRSYSSTSSSDCYRSRSKSYERRRDRHSSPSRSYERRSSPNKSRERRSYDRRSSPRRSWERRSSPQRGRERRSRDKRSSPQKREERSSSRGKKSTSAERLAKKLLESSAVQSLSKQSNVEAVVKTLAPALLAELSKMKSSSLSSTPSSSREEGSSSAASSSSSAMKSSAKSKSGKASPPTMLTLEGVPHCLTHDEVVTAVEQFGKTKSVVLFRAQLEAIVCFEKEEDAKSLRNTKSFTLKGFPISVARERESHKEQKKPEKKTATLSTAKPQTAARKTAGGNLPGNEKTTEKASVKDPARDAKPPKQTVKTVKVEGDVTKPQVKKSGVAKDKGLPKKLETNIKESGLKKSAKGPKMVHETKMSACKGETQKPESPTGPPTVVKDKEMSEKTAKENSTSTTGGKRRDVEMSKLEDCKSKVKESGPKQLKSEAETNDMKDPDPPELGQPRAAGSEPKKVESCTEGKEQNLSAVETVPDKPKESEAAAKLRDGAEAAAVKDPSGNLPGLTAAAETEREPAAATSMEAVTPLTIGEMMEQHLHQKRIVCLKMKTCFSEKFCSLGKKQLLITNLPEYSHGCYTEQDIVDLLTPFGFQYSEESIYVIPQIRMAFAFMPTVEDVLSLMKARQGLNLKGSRSKLRLHVLGGNVATTPLGFYKSVMKLMSSPVADHGSRTIFVKNILPSEARNLRETLRKIVSVRNFLPLLSKVFIELESDGDADLIGVWYALLKQPPTYEIHRLKVPQSACPPLSPPTELLQLLGQRLRVSKFGVPKGSAAPFWLTMTTTPFLFPTVSPWFVIPEYLTVTGEDTIQEASSRGAKSPTIMLTGLPETQYKHEDIAELVWSYFSKRSLQSLYYNVIVLPLQRRAFVYFEDWTSCCNFVRDHFKSPVSVGGTLLHVHFVLQSMSPESREEDMYISLMKLSNAHVSAPESLEERLLCVEILKMKADATKLFLEMVASIARFASVLPLANRMCIEMADSSGLTKVVENYNLQGNDTNWKLVQRCETLKSLKQRLQDSREITVKHGMVTVVSAVFPTGSEPAPQSSIPTADPAGSTNSEAVSAGQSTTEGSSVAVKNEGKQPGAEVAMDSSVGPKAKDTAEKVKVTGEEGTLMSVSTDGETSASPVSSAGSAIPAASNQILSATTILHEEKTAEVPQEWGTGSKVSQANFLFSEQNFNIDDFVTVDEVCDGPEDTSADQPTETASSSKGFNRGKTMRQSSSASSASKRTSARSLKDSRSSAAASSTSSSRLTRSSVKCSPSPHTTSVSPKKAKDSSALTKTSSSAKASSSSLSTESSSVLGVSQQSKTISPNKESNTSSQSCRTRSSSVREKETSATTVQVSHVTHSKSIKKEAKTTESAGAKSDNKVSGQGLDLISKAQEGSPLMGKDLQSLETELKDTEEPPAKDLAKEENTDDNESYQILDSFDEETDYLNQEGSYENQLTGPEKGSQDEGKALPEECSDMEVGGSFQVLDSVTEDQAAADQADSHQVEVKQLPKKDEIPVVNNTEDETAVEDTKDKENKTSNQDHIQLLDSESKSAVTDGGDGKKRKHEEEDAEAFKDGDGRCGNIPSEDNKDALKDPDSDGTEQETFEILDSIDDQPATEDDNLLAQSPGTSCDQKSKEDTIPLQEEEDQITDSVEDQPTESETDNKKRKCKNDTPSKDKPSRRPAATTRGSKIEEKSQKKQDKTVKKHETKTKDDPTAGRCKSDKIKDIFEDQYKVVDSIEDETVQAASIPERSGRRMISGGKTEDKQHTTASVKPVKGEEATFKILDSVDDEISTDEMTIKARSVRGKRARTTKTSQEDIRPTRSTPSRESQEVNREKSPKEEKAHSKESISTKKTDSAVEDDKAKDEASGRRRRGRPKKEIETAKKDSAPLPKGDKDLDEEEAGYQILDSVENKIKDEPPATGGRGRRGRPKKEVRTTKKDKASLERSDQNSSVKEADEEEAIYQILDSVEEEMVDNYSPTEQHESAGTEDITKKSAKKKGKGEEPMYQIVDSLEVDQVQEEPPAAEVSDKEDSREGNELRKGTRKDGKKENNLSRTPQRSTKVRKTKERKNTSEAPSNLVTLDEVSEEEEDFSDDTVEEEKVRKRQAAVKEKRFAKEEEERKHQEREERRSGEQEEREHRSSSEGTRRTMEEEQKEDVRAPESRERARDITEEELQALVTLDEIVEEEEEEEEGKPCLLSQEDESAGSINPEMLVTLDEAGDEEEKVAKDQPVEISRPAKRRHDDTEENMNFVTVDEVVEEEEEDEQEEKEAPTPNTRGRGRKRSRRTPVRKSTRGKKGSEKEETQAAGSDVPPPTSVVAPSSLDLEIKKTASAGQELTPEQLDNQNQGGGKRRSEPVGPEAKRSRSQSPCVAATFELPAFRPDNPLGQAFVVPKSGFFCNLCSVFYLNESTAKEVHCSSQRHYDNLKKYYQKLQQQQGGPSTQGSLSD